MNLKAKFAGLFLLLASFPLLFASAEPDKNEVEMKEVTGWLDSYFEIRKPDAAPDIIQKMNDLGLLDKDAAYLPTLAFFGLFFSQNPASIEPCFHVIDKLDPEKKNDFFGALWQANTPQAMAVLETYAKADPKNKQLQWFLTTKAGKIEEVSIDTPAVVRMNWAAFSESGDDKYIRRIISVLPWRHSNDLNYHIIGDVAQEILVSNARQHSKVMEICRESFPDQSPEAKKDLSEVIKKAEDASADEKIGAAPAKTN